MENLNCIRLYFAFQQHLENLSEFYITNYGVQPEFKAGISEGAITVTEVGDIKREIAYHGEVLHTAARLEKLCSKLNRNLLLTESLATTLHNQNGYRKELIGSFQLRGKQHAEKVYEIREEILFQSRL